MAIKAHELRIGNLVFDHLGRVQTVAETRADAYICYLSNGAKLKYKLNTTQPIPLTEECLLKLGFIKDYGGICVKLPESDKEIRLIDWTPFEQLNKEWGVSAMTHLRKRLKYVHQIQNLYFALTGEELKVN